MNKPTIESGYLLLADISGYVPFVIESEAEHASEIVRELLEFIVLRISPTFTTAQIDGDAVFAYAPQDRIGRGETLFELLESTYTAFKDQLLQSSRVRTCECNACRNVARLDLKIALHSGEYIPHEFHKHFDLIGLAPLFIRRREWKEPVKAATDWQGYALFTQECLDQLGLHPDDLRAAEIPGSAVRIFGLSLEARYESTLENRRVFIGREEALHSFSLDFPVHPSALWGWINDPSKRSQWFILQWSARARPGGRTGSGAVNHCYHGIGDTLETILDWRPFAYFTSEYRIRPVNIRIQQTMQFELLSDDETRLHLNIKPAEPYTGWWTRFMCRIFFGYERFVFNRLQRLVESGG